MRVRLYKKTKDNLSYFQILSNGGDVVLNSQGYTDKDARNNGVRSVVENANNSARYERLTSAEGKNYFILKAGNGQEIARSIEFDDAASMEAAISNCITQLPSLTGMEDGEGQPREASAAAAPTNQNEADRGTARGTASEGAVLKEAGAGVSGNIEGMEGYRAAVQIGDAPPPKIKEPKPKKKRKPKDANEKSAGEKVMLKLGTYLFNGVTWQTMRSANEKHYFSFRTAEGKSLMLSSNVQGFATEEEVDAVVNQVINLGPYEGNYEGKITTNGKYYFYLNDTSGKSVAKSFFYDTPEAMQDAIGLLIGRAPGSAAFVVDDYLPCETYGGDQSFHRFFNEEDSNWYFGYNGADGKTLLRSEGYTTEKARENGIDSVTRNAPLDERWVAGQTTDGQFYYALRAGNNQEIARSCYFADEAGMMAGMAVVKAAFAPKMEKAAEPAPRIVDDYLPCEAYAGMEGYHTFEHDGEYYFSYNDLAGNVLLRSEGYKSITARDNGIESVKKNSPIEERWVKKQNEDGLWYFSLLAGNRQEIARTCYHEEEALFGLLRSAVGPLYTPPPPPREPEPVAAPHPVDDYLPCEAYVGTEGYHTFEQDGEYYFSYNDKAGNVILRSEGYKSVGARDNGIESVKKNSPIEERWVKKQNEDGLWYFSLLAGNRQEIARTCYHEEGALFGILRSAVGPMYIAPPSPRAPEPMAAPAPIIVDDYLPCEAYAGPADDDGFRRFMHEGEHYFAYLDKNNEVILRSEAYKSAGAHDNGIQSVKKNAPIEERWVKETTDDGKHYYSLKAGNKQEIARSCYKEDAGALIGGWGIFGAAAAAALAAAAIPVVAKAATPPPPPPPPVVEKPRVVATAPPPPVAAPVVAASSGGFKWWWLLPLLLLLAFLLWKGCDGCNKTAVVAPPVEEPTTAVTPPAVVDTVKEEPAPPAEPAAPVCACSGSDNVIFNIPSGATPKQLSRLGTNPEFGNSHGLDGKGFFEKLTRRYKAGGVDKAFLDTLFKSLGYANGFSDAKAEMFSEVTIPVGTSGNIGYSKAHKTLYATLPTTEKDRMAFNIKGANGCDIHFMKTCGNHFFFCPN